jgi:WD40 repeat protein
MVSLLQTFSGHSNWLYGLSFSPDGKMIATGSLDRTVKLWNTESGLLATLVGHNEGIYDLSFSPDSQIIASASLDKTVKLWKSRDGSLLKTISGHNEGVYGVSFSTDGQIIASASGDGSIKLWSAETLDFENLLKRGCDWLDDYVNTNPNISQEDRHLFQSKGTSSQ